MADLPDHSTEDPKGEQTGVGNKQIAPKGTPYEAEILMSIWATERTEVLLKSWTKLDYPGEAIRELIADQLREVIAEAIDEAEKYGYRRGFETHRELGPNSLEKEKR